MQVQQKMPPALCLWELLALDAQGFQMEKCFKPWPAVRKQLCKQERPKEIRFCHLAGVFDGFIPGFKSNPVW